MRDDETVTVCIFDATGVVLDMMASKAIALGSRPSFDLPKEDGEGFSPSSNWRQASALIAEYGIKVHEDASSPEEPWAASHPASDLECTGRSPSEAAMRALYTGEIGRSHGWDIEVPWQMIGE